MRRGAAGGRSELAAPRLRALAGVAAAPARCDAQPARAAARRQRRASAARTDERAAGADAEATACRRRRRPAGAVAAAGQRQRQRCASSLGRRGAARAIARPALASRPGARARRASRVTAVQIDRPRDGDRRRSSSSARSVGVIGDRPRIETAVADDAQRAPSCASAAIAWPSGGHAASSGIERRRSVAPGRCSIASPGLGWKASSSCVRSRTSPRRWRRRRASRGSSASVVARERTAAAVSRTRPSTSVAERAQLGASRRRRARPRRAPRRGEAAHQQRPPTLSGSSPRATPNLSVPASAGAPGDVERQHVFASGFDDDLVRARDRVRSLQCAPCTCPAPGCGS